MSLQVFAGEVRAEVEQALAPCVTEFKGSLARGSHDELSDVDLEVVVGRCLDRKLLARLEEGLGARFGALRMRWTPVRRGERDLVDVRVSLYEWPVFWQVHIGLRSSLDGGGVWRDSVPDWEVGTSALLNVLWALKAERRGSVSLAREYLDAASRKLDCSRRLGAGELLELLGGRHDVDGRILVAVREVASGAPA